MDGSVKGRTVCLVLAVFLISCSARGEPIVFAKAVDAALRHVPGMPDDQTSGNRLCPAPLQDFAALASQLDTTNEMGGPGPLFAAGPASPIAFASRRNVILCTALVYAKLEDIQSRQQLMHKQQELVSRLMNIESRRVFAEVDHPLLLTQAKMLRARTRMASETLDASEQSMRTALGDLIASGGEPPSVVEGSMAAIPQAAIGGENSRVLQRLLAFRDIVQLEYVSAVMDRQKVAHDLALARASIGTLVAAQAEETMKFAALVQFNNLIRVAKIQSLDSNALEDWAAGKTDSTWDRPVTSPGRPSAASAAPASSSRPLSMLLVPAVEDLAVGKSQQYSAVETDSNGHARDVTTDARWSCSTDTDAVLSGTGLLTALSPSQLTIRVEYGGLVSYRKLSVSTQPVDEDIPSD